MNPWAWQNLAACRGLDLVLFCGTDGERPWQRERREREAKAVCAGCPVRAECLAYALGRPEKYCVYGGMTADEREAERRRVSRRATEARKRAERAA